MSEETGRYPSAERRCEQQQKLILYTKAEDFVPLV